MFFSNTNVQSILGKKHLNIYFLKFFLLEILPKYGSNSAEAAAEMVLASVSHRCDAKE